MNGESLVKMVNQIGDFFSAMPDHDQAVQGVATHLKRFWPPAMRRDLLAHLDQSGHSELNPLAAEALARHRSLLSESST